MHLRICPHCAEPQNLDRSPPQDLSFPDARCGPVRLNFLSFEWITFLHDDDVYTQEGPHALDRRSLRPPTDVVYGAGEHRSFLPTGSRTRPYPASDSESRFRARFFSCRPHIPFGPVPSIVQNGLHASVVSQKSLYTHSIKLAMH
jgi:hypothetical protein